MVKAPQMECLSIIIIAHRGREDHLHQLLDSLKKNGPSKEQDRKFEIILVSDQVVIDDKLAGLLQFLQVRLLTVDGTYSPSVSRNKGAEASKGKWLCFMDSDVVLSENYFEVLEKHLDDGTETIVPRIEVMGDVSIWAAIEHRHDLFSYQKYIHESSMDIVIGHNFVVPKSVFTQVGGFRPELQSAEDRDLGFRLRRMGYNIRYNPQLICYHNYPNQLSDLIRRKWWHGKGSARFYRDYKNARKNLRGWLDYFLLPSFSGSPGGLTCELVYRCTAKVAFLISVVVEEMSLLCETR